MHDPRHGLLLVNLGTPRSPTPADVGVYLREFLMDPAVIRLPWLVRWILVNIIIVPRRRFASAALYKKIWDPTTGSPLLHHSRTLAAAVAKLLPQTPVALAMRYGSPSIDEAFKSLLAQGISQITLVPLYPHYALSSFGTCVDAFKATRARLAPELPYKVVAPFYEHPAYISALAATLAKARAEFPAQHILFSFHGIPVSHVKATDTSGSHCYKTKDCCASFRSKSPDCYKAQCLATVQGVVGLLGLGPDDYSVGFQSRLAGEPWLEPYSDKLIQEFPRRGIKRLLVTCPSFTADCLETLEEIAVRGAEDFHAHGGEDLRLVPAVNANPDWVQALVQLLPSD